MNHIRLLSSIFSPRENEAKVVMMNVLVRPGARLVMKIFKAKGRQTNFKIFSRSFAITSLPSTDHLFSQSSQVYHCNICPYDMKFTGSLDFWHRIQAPNRHFDTRQGKEASVMTKIIASLTIILS